MSRLVDQIRQALAAFAAEDVSPALIGGLALAAHRVVRATQDVYFLVDADDAGRVHRALPGLGEPAGHVSLFDREALPAELLEQARD